MQATSSLSKEAITDVPREASCLIWMLSKRPQSELWRLEKGEPLVFQTSNDIDDVYPKHQSLFNRSECLVPAQTHYDK